MLRFLGRGSAFCNDNNCAFFAQNSRLVLLDCPMSAFHKLKTIGADALTGCKTEKITVLVTHTHSDHTGGIGMLVHFCYYALHIPVEIIAPSSAVKDKLRFLLKELDGCREEGYTLISADETQTGFTPVPTIHSPELAGQCFGWCFEIDGTRVVYTGDTATLDTFKDVLTDGAYLYTETASFDSAVHLRLNVLKEMLPELEKRGIKIYLMHLDDEDKIAKALPDVKFAPLYE